MPQRGLTIEYWQDETGRFIGEADDPPIRVSGDTLAQLRERAAEKIRETFRGRKMPSVYDLVTRADTRLVDPSTCKVSTHWTWPNGTSLTVSRLMRHAKD